ncbi:MAG: GAF and ANTAR domain-containing protein [Acidimicrobiales bacterium]
MLDENLLIRTLVELADNLVEDFDVVELLSHLAGRCVEVLDVDAAGVMLAPPSGALQVVASSSEAMRVLELYELQSDQGPCLDCYATGNAVVNVDLAAAGSRWPDFAPQAVDAGFRSVHALPLRLRGITIGALNLFRVDAGTLGAVAETAAQGLADIATIAIIQHRDAMDAQNLNAQLSEALNSRITIEQAKGKISQAANVDMELAFQRLRSHARSHNLHLSELAADVAAGTLDPKSLDPLR